MSESEVNGIVDQPKKLVKQFDKNTLNLFYKLANKKTSSRVSACIDILRSLVKKQEEIVNQNEPCKDLQYCLERLVKGLASSRDAARLGYALLLTEILKHMDVVHIEQILDLVKKHLSSSGKQEKRDFAFGQLFAYTAIVRSGKLNSHSHLSYIVLSLYDLWQGKDYILIACHEVIVSLFSQLSKEVFKENVWPHLRKKLICEWEKCSADVMWLLLLCLRMFPEVVNEKYLKKHWNCEDIFSSETLDHHKRIIRQTTACLPSLHPYCIEFWAFTKDRKDLKEIWSIIVDDNLYDSNQTEKAFIGFEMVKNVLKESTRKKVIKYVLSPKFRTMFTKSFLTLQHVMHPAASQLAKFLCEYVKSNTVPDVQIIILKAFLQPPGTVLLDQIIRKKEVSSIIQNLLPDAVKAYGEILKSIAVDKEPKSDNDDNNKTESLNTKSFQAVVQMGSLISHPVMISDMEWRMDTIKFLLLHSFFVVKVPTSDILHCDRVYGPLPNFFRAVCMSISFKAIDSLHQRIHSQTATLPQFLQNLQLLANYTDQLMTATENIIPVFPIEKVQEPWNRVKSIVHKLSKQCKKDGKIKESNAFQVLFLQLGFVLLQDPENTSELLEELLICCKKALKDRRHSDDNSNEDNEPPWVGVVVDILLSLLSKPSHHLRTVVSSVFHLLCPFITEEALRQILDVINPKKAEDEPMLTDESDQEENAEFDSGSSSDDESDSNEAENQNVDEVFKKKIKEALGPAAEVSDAESVILTDSEMFNLDDALSKAFQVRLKSGHTQMSSEDKTMLDFRAKSFDLIVSYLKSEPPMHLVLLCVEPILSAYEYGHSGKQQKALLEKAMRTLQFMTTIRKFQLPHNVEKSELKRLLDMLIAKCHKETDMTIAKKLYSLCVFMVLCFRRLESQSSPERKKHQDSKKLPTYVTKYLSALDLFVNGSSSNMYPQFFTCLMDACPDLAWHFIAPCQRYAFGGDTRFFKRTQCLGLIIEALKFARSQKGISVQQWVELGSSLIPTAVETLKNTLNDEGIKPVNFSELLNIILTSHLIVKELTSNDILAEHKDLVPLLTSLDKSKVKKITKKGKADKRKIILCLGGSVVERSNAEETTESHNEGKRKSLSKESKKKKRKSLESDSEKIKQKSPSEEA